MSDWPGEVVMERITRANGGYLVRVIKADAVVRIDLDLLDQVKAGEHAPYMTVEDGWLYVSDDYAHQSCYRLGNLDETGRARWMEKL